MGMSNAPAIHHPQLGWGTVDVVNPRQMRVRFSTPAPRHRGTHASGTDGAGVTGSLDTRTADLEDGATLCWFSLNDPNVALWPMRGAVEFRRWLERVMPR
jgi:hypothetical protein